MGWGGSWGVVMGEEVREGMLGRVPPGELGGGGGYGEVMGWLHGG